MSLGRFFFWLVILLLILLFRPSGVWREAKQMWRQRDYLLRVFVFAIGIYLIYGVYSMYQRGMFPW